MAFLIVLNNKQPDSLMGFLLFFISNDHFFFKFLKDRSLNNLVVIIEQFTTCVAIEMQLLQVFRKVALNHQSGHIDLDNLVVIIEQFTTCVAMEMQLS
jgi:hypothetical protein